MVILTTHLVDLALVHLFALPALALDLLCVCLPFGQEADDVHRVFRATVRPELALDIFVAEDAHFVWKELAMGSQQSTVERDRRQ